MWIRSQDNRLFNLDRVECVYVETRLFDYMSLETSQIEGHTKEFYIRALSSRGDELGTYATEERCIEVLDEIHAYINGEYGTKLAIKSIHESQMKEEIDEKLALELMDKLEFVYVMPEQ